MKSAFFVCSKRSAATKGHKWRGVHLPGKQEKILLIILKINALNLYLWTEYSPIKVVIATQLKTNFDRPIKIQHHNLCSSPQQILQGHSLRLYYLVGLF